jgi:transcriptional regulator with XRE-family HTH domain
VTTLQATLGRHSGTVGDMSNLALIAARTAHNLTQAEFAEAVGVTKRTIQRWEEDIPKSRPRPTQVRGLQNATGMPIEQLGFPADKRAVAMDDGRGGLDLEVRLPPIAATRQAPAGDYSGIWLSRYEYVSSSRSQAFSGLHYVVLTQEGAIASVRSLPNSASSTMGMDLTVDGSVLTGTWVEDTDKTGYYKGKRYVGAIQMIANPSGSRIAGKWLGYGKDGEINSGPWFLDYQSPLSKENVAAYDRLPND